MNMATIKLRTLRFLHSFRQAGGGPLSAVAIWQELTLPGQPTMTKAEFDVTFMELESSGLVAGITPQLGGPALYAITDRGALILASAS